MTYGHEWDTIVGDTRLPGIHLPEETWSRRGGHEPGLKQAVFDGFDGRGQALGVGEASRCDGAIIVEKLHEVLAGVNVARHVLAIVGESKAMDEASPVTNLIARHLLWCADESLTSIV